MQRSARIFVRSLVGLGAVALVAGGVFFWSRHGGGGGAGVADDKKAQAGARPVPVLLATVEQKDMPLWLEGLGSVASFQQVAVRPQVDGKLERVVFTEGQAVKKGQLLASIDPRPFLVQLHQAEGALARDKATIKNAQVNLERYEALRGQQLVAQQQVDDQKAVAGQAEGAIKIDEAAIENAKLNLDYAQVRAPIDGIVGVRLVDQGNLVRASDAASTIVVITQLDPAAVFLTVPQDELPRVMKAMNAGEVVCEAWSRDGQERLARGTLAVVDNQINQATATLRLKALFKNPERTLWPNQFVKARLLLDTQTGALVLPASAIQRGPKGTFVYVVEGDTAQTRDVTVTMTTGDSAIVEGGVRPGDRVVIEGANQLRPGAKVSERGKEGGLATAAPDGGTAPVAKDRHKKAGP